MEGKSEEDSYKTWPCEAIWISGARVSFPTDLSEAVKRYPRGVMFTEKRPDNVEGLEKDMQFALQVRQHKMQQHYMQQQLLLQSLYQTNQMLHNANQQLQLNTNRHMQQLNGIHNSINQQTQSMRQQRQHEEQMQELRRLNSNLQYLNLK